jgi:hypothetical protein
MRVEAMGCPYFEEVVMVFCRAYPLKKLLPRNVSTAASRCVGAGFDRCPFYQEVTARGDMEETATAVSCPAMKIESPAVHGRTEGGLT